MQIIGGAVLLGNNNTGMLVTRQPLPPPPPPSDGPIYTTGLVLNLDAGNVSSYSGTGRTWLDLSPSGLRANIGAGISFTPSLGGALKFNGNTTSIATFANSSPITSLRNNFTMEVWYNSTNLQPKLLSTGSGSSGFSLGQYTINPTQWKVTKYGVIDLYIDSIPQNNNWHQVVLTYSSTNGTNVYVDGALSGRIANNTNLNINSSSLVIGTLESSQHVGNISVVRCYNSALSANLVQQNFNAIKYRYGL